MKLFPLFDCFIHVIVPEMSVTLVGHICESTLYVHLKKKHHHITKVSKFTNHAFGSLCSRVTRCI